MAPLVGTSGLTTPAFLAFVASLADRLRSRDDGRRGRSR